jgi:hypothetical protein
MTWTEMQQAAVDSIACPYCGALATHPCKTRGGRLARYAHGARVWPIQNAWSGGYSDGYDDLLDQALASPEWFQRRLEQRRKEKGSTS